MVIAIPKKFLSRSIWPFFFYQGSSTISPPRGAATFLRGATTPAMRDGVTVEISTPQKVIAPASTEIKKPYTQNEIIPVLNAEQELVLRKGLEFMAQHPTITNDELKKLLKISNHTLRGIFGLASDNHRLATVPYKNNLFSTSPQQMQRVFDACKAQGTDIQCHPHREM